MKKNIVISAINFTEGGPLTILNDCLLTLNNLIAYNESYRVIAFVYDKKKCFYPNITYIEIKKAKNSWLNRLVIEYYYFKKYSKRIKPYLWLSLHDITPNVISEKRCVYFHNPTPFYKLKISDIYFSQVVLLFTLLYRFLYKINVKQNDFIIVQQDWLRDSFAKLIGVEKNKIVVSKPTNSNLTNLPILKGNNNNKIFTFFYPSYPRSFKNFEIICEAVVLLKNKGINCFEIFLTIDGNENRYSKWVYNKYRNLNNVFFIGLLSRDQVESFYKKTDCLLFPSKLETWGLPISEFISYDKPMLLADLPYAYETASNANKVSFFNPENANELADKMETLIKGDFKFLNMCPNKVISEPFFNTWPELLSFLIS